jgi:hypothetical protein
MSMKVENFLWNFGSFNKSETIFVKQRNNYCVDLKVLMELKWFWGNLERKIVTIYKNFCKNVIILMKLQQFCRTFKVSMILKRFLRNCKKEYCHLESYKEIETISKKL